MEAYELEKRKNAVLESDGGFFAFPCRFYPRAGLMLIISKMGVKVYIGTRFLQPV